MNNIPKIKTKRLKKAILDYFNFKSFIKKYTGGLSIPTNKADEFDAICYEVHSAIRAENKTGIISAGLIVINESMKNQSIRTGFITTASDYEDGSFKIAEKIFE